MLDLVGNPEDRFSHVATQFIPGFTVPLGLYPVLFLLGILMWTFDEYVVHRWLFHLQPPADSKFLIYAHFLLHGQHHKVNNRDFIDCLLINVRHCRNEHQWLFHI